MRTAEAREHERAVVRKRGGEGSQHVISEGQLPAGVAESPVKLDQGWVASLVAPGELPIL